jgi:hypothetical protein
VLRRGDRTEPDTVQVRRYGHSAVAVKGGRLVVAGGDDDNGQCVALVEVLDIAAGRWDSAPPLLTARYRHSCAEHDGKLYVAGGNAGLQGLDSVEVLNLSAPEEWVEAESFGVI